MTEELTIQAADNGMLVSSDEWTAVIENTHSRNEETNDNLIAELGKIFHGIINENMNQMMANIVRVKIEITKQE